MNGRVHRIPVWLMTTILGVSFGKVICSCMQESPVASEFYLLILSAYELSINTIDQNFRLFCRYGNLFILIRKAAAKRRFLPA